MKNILLTLAFSLLASTSVSASTLRRGSEAAFGGFLARRRQRKQQKIQHDLLVSRRTINAFEPELPDNWETALNTAITAATYAPNHKRTEPWRFHVLGPKSIEQVCRLNAELVAAKKGDAAGQKKLKRWLAMPGWIVVTCVKPSDENSMATDPTSLAREDYAAVCCAVQNLCLSLHAQGLGTKWTTGPVNFCDGFSTAVGFSPAEEYVVGTIWFGTPAAIPSPPGKKKSLQEIVTFHD